LFDKKFQYFYKITTESSRNHHTFITGRVLGGGFSGKIVYFTNFKKFLH